MYVCMSLDFVINSDHFTLGRCIAEVQYYVWSFLDQWFSWKLQAISPFQTSTEQALHLMVYCREPRKVQDSGFERLTFKKGRGQMTSIEYRRVCMVRMANITHTRISFCCCGWTHGRPPDRQSQPWLRQNLPHGCRNLTVCVSVKVDNREGEGWCGSNYWWIPHDNCLPSGPVRLADVCVCSRQCAATVP